MDTNPGCEFHCFTNVQYYLNFRKFVNSTNHQSFWGDISPQALEAPTLLAEKFLVFHDLESRAKERIISYPNSPNIFGPKNSRIHFHLKKVRPQVPCEFTPRVGDVSRVSLCPGVLIRSVESISKPWVWRLLRRWGKRLRPLGNSQL